MKAPFIIHLKNQDPVLLNLEAPNCKEIPESVLYPQLPPSIPKGSVTGVTCFCVECQCKIIERLSFIMVQLEQVHDCRMLLRFVPQLDPEENPMAKEWHVLQHLVMGAVAAQKYWFEFKGQLSKVNQA